MTDNEETLSDGKKIIRDERGRFKQVSLDSDTARDMQEKSSEVKRTKGPTLQQLLEEAGFGGKDCPQFVKSMGEQALGSTTGMQHWREFCGYRSQHEVSGTVLDKPAYGQDCPLCGRSSSPLELLAKIKPVRCLKCGEEV